MRLEDLVAQKVRLKRSGRELVGLCPFHEEKTPSFHVNPAKQRFFCQGCEKSGGTYVWLTQMEGMSKAEAMRALDKDPPVKPAPEKKKLKRVVDLRRERDKPWVVAHHLYRDAKRKTVLCVLRSDKKKYLAAGQDPKWFGKCKPYSPTDRGWVNGLEFEELRPIYRLPDILELKPDQQIMIVEGEKCVDTVTHLWRKVPATCNIGGSGKTNWTKTDWSPVYGHPVMIVADADLPGHKWARGLGRSLTKHCPSVKLVLPEIPKDKEQQGHDIHDWLTEGGKAKAADMIRKHLSEVEAAPKKKTSKPKKDPEPPKQVESSEMDGNPWFEVLGNVHDELAVMLSTNRVLCFARTQMVQPATLIAIADSAWWCNLLDVEALSAKICQPVGSTLIRLADRLGQVDMGSMTGRGLYQAPSGEWVWHLGDRLWTKTNGVEPLDARRKERLALAGPPLKMHDEPASVEDRRNVARAVSQYRWQSPKDASMYLGWIVASLVGGGLEWRPHMWIVAPPETGKSWIIKNVAAKILGEASVPLADATPAAIARRMRSDSLPMLLDEAEPDRQWIDNIMDLVRIAAGEDGERIRAEGPRSVQSFQPRFSALMSSVKVSNLSGANKSRFVFPELSLTPVNDWPGVKNAIQSALAGDMGLRVRTAIMHDAGEIVKAAQRYTDEISTTVKCSTRRAMIYGALSAGWAWMCGREDTVALRPADRSILASNPTEDARQLLNDILGLRMLTAPGLHESVAKILEGDDKAPITMDHGICRDTSGDLLIATGHPSLRAVLARTPWRMVDIRKVLLQLEGTIWTNTAMRWPGGIRKRCVVVPQDLQEALGFA